MPSAETIEETIFRAIEAVNQEREPDSQIVASIATPLFGVDAELDSLEFVSVITDVETSLNLDHGLEISLADDRAMSRAESPYATVAALRDYILELTG